jgi:sodium transport system permease protein
MRLSILLVILQKELLETLRDRRTLMRMLILPALMYPLFALGMGKLAGAEAEAREARASRVAVWGELPAEVASALSEGGKVELLPWEEAPDELRRDLEAGAVKPSPRAQDEDDKADKAPPDEAVERAARVAFRKRKVHAVLVPFQGFSSALTRGEKGQVGIYYDSVWGDSRTADDRLEDGLARARKKLLEAREKQRELPAGFTSAIDMITRNVAPKERRLGQLLGAIMPMMLILMSLLGGFLPAVDFTAGEKERGTMQTLLCAPLRPIEIIWGKFLAVFTISLLSALANIVSLAFTVKRMLPGEMEVPLSAHVYTFALLIPVTFLFSALFLGLAVFARDFKDAQNVLMPVYLPVTLVSALTSLPGIELNAWTSFAPLLNVALLIKSIYLGEASPDLAFYVVGSSVLYAGLALVMAARVFEQEDVLLGGRGSWRDVVSLRRQKGGAPTPGLALGAFGAIMVLSFYGSLALEKLGKAPQLVTVQLGFFLLPVILTVALSGASPRETLALRMPPLRALLGAVLAGVSVGIVVAAFAVRLVPMPTSFSQKLGEALMLDGLPFWALFACIALLPALCEEAVFRGLLFSGLLRVGPLAAIVASALLFGLAHGSIYRLLPTASIGLVLGWARLSSRSIAPGMLIHAINNGLAAAILYYQPPWATRYLEGANVPWSIAAGALVLLGAGLFLMRPAAAPERGGEGPAGDPKDVTS